VLGSDVLLLAALAGGFLGGLFVRRPFAALAQWRAVADELFAPAE
jgi:hypothetical protein